MIKEIEAFEYKGMLFKTKEEIDNYILKEVRKELLNHCWDEQEFTHVEESLANILDILLANNITSKEKIMKLKEVNR